MKNNNFNIYNRLFNNLSSLYSDRGGILVNYYRGMINFKSVRYYTSMDNKAFEGNSHDINNEVITKNISTPSEQVLCGEITSFQTFTT